MSCRCIVVVGGNYQRFRLWCDTQKPTVPVSYATSAWHIRGLGQSHKVVVLGEPTAELQTELKALQSWGVEIEYVR